MSLLHSKHSLSRLICGIFLGLLSVCIPAILTSCSDDDEKMRTNADIVGVWSPSPDRYFEFSDGTIVRRLTITEQDGQSIGTWVENVYFYEPGYNLVIYLEVPETLWVYQVVTLTDNELVWCPVKNLRETYDEDDDIGQIIGEIINEAQAGFKLDPEKFQYFERIPEDTFLQILENIGLLQPW